ncbi:MAG: hypothetical protein IT347_12495 [Candidatus Eisenbacteria bacterium]|nr:hypothetical protein [Candidatus Eisenbacteria bacterium]
MKLVSRYAGPLHALAILWLLLSRQLLSRSPGVIAVQVAAVALSVWARAAFPPGQFSVHPEPKQPRLIEAGPYRWLRHPMYTAAQALVWSGALQHRTVVNLAIAAALLAAVIVRIADEEKLLRERIPGYADYALRTKRFVPFVF